MTIMKSVDYVIHVNCTEETQCKLKTVIPVLKRFVTHTRDFLCSNCHYDKYDQWKNTNPGMIAINPKRDFSLFLRDLYFRGLKLCWKEELGLHFDCWNNKRVWFLRQRCEYTGYYDYKPTDFYLGVTESDSSYEKLCEIDSNK